MSSDNGFFTGKFKPGTFAKFFPLFCTIFIGSEPPQKKDFFCKKMLFHLKELKNIYLDFFERSVS